MFSFPMSGKLKNIETQGWEGARLTLGFYTIKRFFFFSCLFLLFYQFIENEIKQLIVVKLLYSMSLGFNTAACIRWRKRYYVFAWSYSQSCVRDY